MAAVLIMEELTSSTSGVDKTLDTVRFKKSSDSNVDTNNPITIPSSGNVCSYTKVLRMKITTAPDNNVTNIQCYTGGNPFPTGYSVYYKKSASFVAPTDVIDSSDRVNKGITDDLFNHTVDNPLILGSGLYSTTGYVGDHLILCLQVDSTATAMTLPPRTITIGYDES